MSSGLERQAAAAGEAPAEVVLRSDTVDGTRAIGRLLGEHVQPGDVILLRGNLGSGKTVLTQGIAQGLGIAAVVNSPTFTILKEYAGRLPLYHFDLYRVDDPAELETLGFADYFESGGVSVVEWAERGEGAEQMAPWPDDWLRVAFSSTGTDERILRCTAHGPHGTRLLRVLAHTAETGEAE